ncbi:hypothetical protein BMS3Bbin06_00264 [bacterium BMS3Bbin06]|nr:hypothetical protein BMS3Bbin06_00264 [bacterium BMS3Bbin06]
MARKEIILHRHLDCIEGDVYCRRDKDRGDLLQDSSKTFSSALILNQSPFLWR